MSTSRTIERAFTISHRSLRSLSLLGPALLTGPWFSLHMEAFLVYTSLHEAAEDRWSNAASRYVGDDSALGGASGGSRRESEQCDEELRAVPDHDLSLVAG